MYYGVKDSNNRSRTYYKCLCDCGNIVLRTRDHLIRKGVNLQSCGCARKEIGQQFSRDIVGQKFGMLTVINELKQLTPRKVTCKCQCGNVITVSKTDIMSGHTLSCGCLQKQRCSKHNTKDWTGYVSDYGVKAIRALNQDNKGRWRWEYECPVCHKLFPCLPANVADGSTTSCGCRTRSSMEELISNYLDDQHVTYQTEYTFPDCRNINKLRFDFALIRNGEVFYLIEFDGKQHFVPISFFGGEKTFHMSQHRDHIKNHYCQEHDIPLLRLNYTMSPEEIKKEIANIIYP
ncbi:MAG: hypothetical protein [Bacteriophage sp.]|nr:MAG: hypothetical protein [Bacteriophage sp.]